MAGEFALIGSRSPSRRPARGRGVIAARDISVECTSSVRHIGPIRTKKIIAPGAMPLPGIGLL